MPAYGAWGIREQPVTQLFQILLQRLTRARLHDELRALEVSATGEEMGHRVEYAHFLGWLHRRCGIPQECERGFELGRFSPQRCFEHEGRESCRAALLQLGLGKT